MLWSLFVFLLLARLAAGSAEEPDALKLVLPTSNRALLDGNPSNFYQYTYRTFEGRRSRPWQAGQYGFVRNGRRTDSRDIVYTRFHEGVDIRARFRDHRGEPLDSVFAIDSGTVVYVNDQPDESNYGNYVVVEHAWDTGPYYSLYAHLGAVLVAEGARVRQGRLLGIVGYTGRGVNRERAHLHFEINMLVNRNFTNWHDTHFVGEKNYHGIYNGLNLIGLNVAEIYASSQSRPNYTMRDYFAEEEAFFTVTVSEYRPIDLFVRYPWLLDYDLQRRISGWSFTFTRSGMPLKITPVAETTTTDVQIMDPSSTIPCQYKSHLLSEDCLLSEVGERFVALFTWTADDDRAGVPFSE